MKLINCELHSLYTCILLYGFRVMELFDNKGVYIINLIVMPPRSQEPSRIFLNEQIALFPRNNE